MKYGILERGTGFGEPWDGVHISDVPKDLRTRVLQVRAGLGETYEERRWMDLPGDEVDRAVARGRFEYQHQE